MPDPEALLTPLATALGLGLLIGVVRERRHDQGAVIAGTRTHALLALLGAIGALLGPALFIAVLVGVAALAVVAYLKTANDDPGLTGETAMLATALLGGLAAQSPALAGGLGVLVAILLHAKQPLRRFSRDLLKPREIDDALMLAAAALVVMPLLPDAAIDPWGVLHLPVLWRIVVLVMAVGLAGHVAMRAIGPERGLPLAGFFAGFASSTAAVASFAARARSEPAQLAPAASAALLANLASLLLVAVILGTASPAQLGRLALPLGAGGTVLALAAAIGLRRNGHRDPAIAAAMAERAVRPAQALLLAGLIGTVLLLSAWLRSLYGDSGAIVAAVLVALAELHAAVATLAQLEVAGDLAPAAADRALVAILAASALAKSALAFIGGGRTYGLRVAGGLVAMVAAAALALPIFGG